nr:cytochrome c oxidase assembly protein [Paracoccaceae bacterium]
MPPRPPGGAAQAHVAAAPGSQSWSAGRPDLWVVAAILLTLGAYLLGLTRLWRASGVGRGIGVAPAACFLAGTLALLGALASPLEGLAGALLTAHMAQHVILIAVAPPLIVLGRPEVAFAWALPRPTRRGVARQPSLHGALRLLQPLLQPVPAALLHGAAVWFWHAPRLFQAALADPLLHGLEHASFFATALAFWYATLHAARVPSAAPA